MMVKPIRLTTVMTHPVQYFAPWFRYIQGSCPEIDLTVLYATEPTDEQQGTGFGASFQWDIPLLEGYSNRVVRPARPEDDVHSNSFRGLDVPEIGKAILETRPDVVLIPGWHSVTQVRAIRACRRARIPILYRGDSNLLNRPRGWKRFAKSLRTRLLLRRFSAYLSVGRRAREYLLHHGVPAARIFSSPHCVDNDYFSRAAAPHQSDSGRTVARKRFGISENDFVVLFVGKFEEKKRPLDLVRAAAKLDKDVTLLMVGTGPLLDLCRAEAEQLGIEAAWAGFLNQSQLGPAYAAADCLVLPSDAGETWGLVVNEALGTGRPCVVSDRVGCAQDLIESGETGEVYRMGDISGLATALENLRRRTRDGFDWESRCRARADQYSFAKATTGLLAACQRSPARRKHAKRSPQQTRAPRVLAACGGMVIFGGMERMVFEVLRVVREPGGAVHCIVNNWENHRIVPVAQTIGASWSEGFYEYRVTRHQINPLKCLRLGWQMLRTSQGMLKDAFRFRPTHVLLPEHHSALVNAPVLLLLRFSGVRIVMRLGVAPSTIPFYRRLWKWIVNPIVDDFVCNSRFTRDQLLACDVPKHKVRYIYNTLPERDVAPSNGHVQDLNKVIYVGQIIPEKGVHVLLDALSLLVQRGHDVRLDVVGQIDGWEAPQYRGYRESLRERAAQDDLGGRVAFLGWREEVPELLARAGVHCCPSLPEQREAFGIVNIEAKAAGLPTVVFPSGALPELIAHGKDGWLCTAFTAEALADVRAVLSTSE